MAAQLQAMWAVRKLSTPKLIEKMTLSLIPSEKEFILDACDEVKRRCSGGCFKESTCQQVIDEGGVEMLLDVMNEWGKDEVVLRAAVRALTPLASAKGDGCEHILELGGRRAVEDAKEAHLTDDELQQCARGLLKVLLGKGAVVAVKEIRLAIFCTTNHVEFSRANELLRVGAGRGKNAGAGAKAQDKAAADMSRKDRKVDRNDPEAVLATDFEIVKVVVHHMAQHAADEGVQEAACDAFIAIGRNANLEAFVQTNAAELLVKAMAKFEKAFQLQWKACVAVAHIAEKHAGASSELGKKGVISQLVALFWRFNGDDKEQPRELTLQQQVLWALGALAAEEVNVERMKNAELFRVLWLILRPKEGPSKKELEQQRWADANRSSADKRASRASRASRGSGDDMMFGRGSRSSGDDLAGGALFLTVPLVLCRVWTLKELKELCKRPPPEPEKKKKLFSFTRAAKPKYGRAGDDFSEGEGGLL